MRRRSVLTFAAAALFAPSLSARVLAAAGLIDVQAILNDREAPVGGNPKGDVTIVAFLDYNCPFCKKVTPPLDKVVAADGGVRLVYKDWPILAESSVDGARMALAAKYQGKYLQAHAALMAVPGRNSRDRIAEAIRNAGVPDRSVQGRRGARRRRLQARRGPGEGATERSRTRRRQVGNRKGRILS